MSFKFLGLALCAIFFGTMSQSSAALVTDTFTGFASSSFSSGANTPIINNSPFVATYTFDLSQGTNTTSSSSETFTGITTASLIIGGQSVSLGYPSGLGLVAYSPLTGIFQDTFYGQFGYLTTSISLASNTTNGLGTSFYASALPGGFDSGTEYTIGDAPIVLMTTSVSVSAVPLPSSLLMFVLALLVIVGAIYFAKRGGFFPHSNESVAGIALASASLKSI